MDERVYTAFLIGVGRDSATFATVTHYNRGLENNTEARSPSMSTAEKMGEVLYTMDREARSIKNWTDLYRWLGRDVGTWAAFTEGSAAILVPHWFSESVEYTCKFNEKGPTEFVDVNSLDVSGERLAKFQDLAGTIDSREGHIYAMQIQSNFVLTTQPIFID